MLHGYVEHIAMEEPGSLAIFKINFELVHYSERTQLEASKFAHHLIMIPCDVVRFLSLAYPMHEVLHHFHVRIRPISFAKLPNVDDVAVQNNCFRIDAFEVVKEFFCVATVGAEVYV